MVFRRNRMELLWFLCISVLALIFSGTLLAVLIDRIAARWEAGSPDLAADSLWVLVGGAILVTTGLVWRELLRFLRRRVILDDRGLIIGRERLAWEQVLVAREAREFRAGAWFYHMEFQGRAGERLWVTSGLIADYAGFRTEIRRRSRFFPLVLVPD